MKGYGVRSRLAALVLVPTVCLGGFAVSDVADHLGAAHDARAGERHVVIANQLIDLRRSLSGEEFAEGAVGTARRFGVDEATIGTLLGMKDTEDLAASRAAVDSTQRSLAANTTAPSGLLELPDLRAGFDDGSLSFAYVLAEYSAIESALSEATGRELRIAKQSLARVSGSGGVLEATTVLDAAEEEAIASGSEIDALGRLLATDSSVDPQSELAQLRSGVARFATTTCAPPPPNGSGWCSPSPSPSRSAGWR